MIEKELKALVSEKVYLKLLEAFEWDKHVIQMNYYFADEKHELVKNDISVRVRHLDDRFLLQIKKPVLSDGALKIKEEFEEVIESVPELIFLKKIQDVTGLEVGDAFMAGILETERRSVNLDNSVCLFLDRNSYLGCVDYEVEVEFENEIDEALLSSVRSYGVDFGADAEGKYQRFMSLHKENF